MPRRLLAVTLLLFVACQPDAVQNPGSNRPPLAVIVPVPAREEGALISLDGTRSSDPDDDSLSYAWSFGDGGGAPGAIPAHAFQDDGSYTVTLVVKDRAGAADTATTQAVISNAPPVITSLLVPAEQRIDSAAKISVAVRDPGSADTYDLIVEWGDGARDTIPGAKEAAHKYKRPGSYHVQVTARDDDGAEGSRSGASPIDVFDPTVNRRPVATVSGPSETREGAIVQFSAVGSMDPDGDSLTFIWLHGDGNTGNGVRTGWAYGDNGTFTVSVIVRDGRGGADTATTVVVVHNTPPTSLVVDPPFQQAPGLLLSTRVTFSDSGVADTHLLTVDWGDGKRDSVTIKADQYQRADRFIPSVLHPYAVSGTYSVRATVRDKDGAAASATAGHVVEVIDPSRRRTIAGYEVVDLGTLGGNSARPHDFNDYGMVVGSSLTTSGRTHAFLWNDGDMRDLGTLGQDNSAAERINNAGVIAGTVWPATPDEGCSAQHDCCDLA
jgi:probable HAF family extracellular repeat protein